MREIKIRTPIEFRDKVSTLAIQAGAQSVALTRYYDAISATEACEVKVKTSTPIARQIVRRLSESSYYDARSFAISSHEIRSLVLSGDAQTITKPFCVPLADVSQDLWQNTHVTASFLLRVTASAMLLAYGMLRDRTVLMIGGMLFTVFSPPLMAIGFGIPMKDHALIRQAIKAFLWANGLSILGAALTTLVAKGPLQWDDFGSMGSNLFISTVAALVGAIADTDDAGRRQLIAIAAAFPYSRFPPWLGIHLILGFPNWTTTSHNLTIFAVNIVAMIATAAFTYTVVNSSWKEG